MARVQLLIRDEDRDRFAYQARAEGMTLSAWLRAAAHQRLGDKQKSQPFQSVEELHDFFCECDEIEGPETEPDWEQHLRVIEQSRRRGAADT